MYSGKSHSPHLGIRGDLNLTLGQITSAPKPRWKQLAHRRLQTWPSDLVNNKLLDAPLPGWLREPVIPRLKSICMTQDSSSHIFSDSPHQEPNHVLVNEYPPGVGIMPHKVGLFRIVGGLVVRLETYSRHRTAPHTILLCAR